MYSMQSTQLKNYIWVELIGFDNEKEDFGVADYLQSTGFVPEGISFLLTSVDFVNLHTGMTEEYALADDFCSYAGHPYNCQRARQKWTNYQLRGLIAVLRSYKIQVYCSFFDYACKSKSLLDTHPELKVVSQDNGKTRTLSLFGMISRFADGSYYEDFLLEKMLLVLKDFGFDGMHLADGIVRPRIPIQSGDFSQNVIEQSGIAVPGGEEACTYILTHKRKEWIAFYQKRWAAYLNKLISGIHGAGFRVITNSAWPKDPAEAIYRYGVDYRTLEACGIDGFVAENGAPTIAMLDDDANAGCRYTYADRKMVHHLFFANLILDSACMPSIPMIPLYPLQDTLEQYDVLRHTPSALERHSAMMSAFFCVDGDGALIPIVQGHTYCLGDGLTREEWQRVTDFICSGVTEQVYDVPGATFVWSDARNEAEVVELITHRTWTSRKWLSELLSGGAAIRKIVRIEHLDKVQGDIVVTNPQLLPAEELAAVNAYKNGRVFCLSHPQDPRDYSGLQNPVGFGFPYPLEFAQIDRSCLNAVTGQINEGLAYISDYSAECHVTEVCCSPKTSRFFVENEEYYYTRPRIHTGRKIKSAAARNRIPGFPIGIKEDSFKILVPLRGVTVIDIEFEEE